MLYKLCILKSSGILPCLRLDENRLFCSFKCIHLPGVSSNKVNRRKMRLLLLLLLLLNLHNIIITLHNTCLPPPPPPPPLCSRIASFFSFREMSTSSQLYPATAAFLDFSFRRWQPASQLASQPASQLLKLFAYITYVYALISRLSRSLHPCFPLGLCRIVLTFFHPTNSRGVT